MSASSHSRLFVTGATGQLGRLVIDALLKTAPASDIVAGVRDPHGEGAKSIAALGVEIRAADYTKPEGLAAAFAGIGTLLLISSSELGQRFEQHRNVIEAAKTAGVGLIVYTSVLHADTSPLGLAEEHRQTEVALRASGMAFVVLRNGWYTENYVASIPPALRYGVFLGSAGQGRISSAARVDYAEAAAAVLLAGGDIGGTIYELAGDEAYVLADLAREIATRSGKAVVYKDLPEADYRAALVGAGLPEPIAALLADSDAGAAKGALFEGGRQLSSLIGRPTTPMSATVAQALAD